MCGISFALSFDVRELTRRSIAAAGGALVVCPHVAWAHTGRAPEPHDLWSSWTFAPAVIVGLALACWCYARGVRALWRAAGAGRGIPRWRVACFGGGVAATALALLSPIDAMGTALFAAHMTQHMLLVVVAAPLLVLGDAGTAALWALRIDARRAVGAWWRPQRVLRAVWETLRRPLVAFTLHVGALWLWHVPTLYDAALRHESVHVAEHATFFLTALLFWYPIADPHRRRRFGVGVATLYLFAAGLQCTLLGALITFASHPWYFAHYATTAPWGLTPLEDQQLAGLIMWIPAGLVYLVALIPTVLPVLRGGNQWVATPTAAGVSARGTP
jgi:cytochrome c oxidase assembly factor CtaG